MSFKRTIVVDIRSGRKRFSISGSLLPFLLFLVLLVAQTSARPSKENASPAAAATTTKLAQKHAPRSGGEADVDDSSTSDTAFDAGDEYTDVDNVEWHHVKIVDGVMHEDHPIIMYKEDFVSEDYDPNQHHVNSNEGNRHSRRRYKNLQRRLNRTAAETEKYHALKPEKIYFDILPEAPIVVTDDSNSDDSKFEMTPIRVGVISLLDDETSPSDNKVDSAKDEVTVEEQSKQLLNKHPKKYHRRTRRDVASEHESHVLHKRTPHYVYERVGPNSFSDYNRHWMNYNYNHNQNYDYWGPKHPVAGSKWNGIDMEVPPAEIDFQNRFGGEDNTDRVVWGSSKASARPRPTTRPPPPQFPPLFHESNPENADFSGFAPRPSNNNNNDFTTRRPSTTRRPPAPQFPPLFHDSNPENADFSGFTRPPVQRPNSTPTTPPPRASSNSISNNGATSISKCVWAITTCCSSSNSNIRYSCFEREGCLGAFWGLNPCADSTKNAVFDYVYEQFQ